jgi:hypothetical protein
VISSEHEEIFRIFDLVSQHQAYSLDGLFSSVDVISQKEIVGVSWKTCIFEQLYQVGVLSVDVAWVNDEVPQILMGASSSRSMGCSRKISLALRQMPLISDSRSFTSLPPFYSSLLMILSMSTSSAVFI